MEQQDLDMKTPGRNVTSGDVSPKPPLTRVIQGTALRTAIREAKSLSDRLGLLAHFMDVCRAVGVAHGRGIIHRALHPSSIVITEFGECVVSDWSLSKARRKEDSRGAEIEAALKSLRCRGVADALETSRALLDPAFLAPEFARGHMESVDTRSDVYALGAVLYELLTGQPPFTGENPADVLDAVASRKPTPVSEVEPTVSTELANICERAMHQEPSARYASAKHLAEELERTTVTPRRDTTGRSYGTAPQTVPLPKAQSAGAGEAAGKLGRFPISGLHGGGPRAGGDRTAGNREASQFFRIALALVGALLVLVIGIAAFSQRRVVRERDEAMAAQRQGEQQLAALQQEHDQLARELEDTQAARREAEAERDQAEAGRREALENARKAQEQIKKTEGELSQQSAPEEGTARQEPRHPTGISQEQVSLETPGTDETSTPASAGAMPIAPPRNMPARFLGPYAGGQPAAAADAGQRPPGVTRAQLARALPQLIGTLKMGKTQDSKMAVMVGTPGDGAVDSLKLLGFKDGDVITNINRSAIETVEQAKSAFESTKNDSGLTVRIVREGQSSWMRINVFEKLPPMLASPRGGGDAQQAPGRTPTPPQNIPINPPSKGEPPPETSPQEAPQSPAQPQEEPPPEAPRRRLPTVQPPTSQEAPETGARPAEETPPAETPAESPSAEQSKPQEAAPEASAAESPPSEKAPASTEPTPAEETTAGEPAPSPESETVEDSQSSDQR